MSFLSTSSNYNQNSVLTDKKLISLDKTQENSNKSFVNNQNNYEIKNIYNKLDYEKLKGIKRYGNFPIFSDREKNNKKNRHLILKLKNNVSSSAKINRHFISIKPIYITQNASFGDMTQLLSILDKNKDIKNKNASKFVNNKKKLSKIIERVTSNDNISKSKRAPIRNCFLNKLEKALNRSDSNTNKSTKFLLNKRLYESNRFRKVESSRSNYISKFHEFLNNKKSFELKKERYMQFMEHHMNKIEFEEERNNSLCNSQELLEKKYITKYKKYILEIYKDFDIQENIDNILCDKIIELKKVIHLLKKKIDGLLTEKNDCLKWMLFQFQIKEKLLKLPKQYKELFQINKKLPDNLIKYQKEIIYPSPEELINRINAIENNSINLMEIFSQNKSKIFPLKVELERIKINLGDTKEIKKINDLILIKEKIKAENELLINSIITIKNKLKINATKSSNGNKCSIIFQKIRYIYFNIFGKEIGKKRYKTEETEILNMLSSIEILYNKEIEKNKYYKINYKEQYEILNSKIIKNKISEKVIKNKNKLIELKKQSNDRIIEKANKKVLLPKIKINWDVYKIKMKDKSQINKNNSKRQTDEIEKAFEYFSYN